MTTNILVRLFIKVLF